MSVGGKHALCEAPGFEQRKTQQHRVAHARPDGLADVCAGGDAPYQHGVDRNADHNHKALETEGEQASEIALAHAAPLLAHHRRHGDGGYAGDEANLEHAPIGPAAVPGPSPPEWSANQAGW